MALLSIDDLVVGYGRGRRHREVLHGVSLDIRPGETVGLIGESGSGKTTIGRAVLGLVRPTSGSIAFEGREITRLPKSARRALSADLQVVFQDPYSSMNPTMTIEQIISEPMRRQGVTSHDARQRVTALLDAVGLPAGSGRRFPREFSGGQRQRVAIARALSLRPRLIICDEPVSALDLTTQARVLDLLVDIQEQTGVAYLFVTHDLSVVRRISHRVAVIFRGEIVEFGDCEEVTSRPTSRYTQMLAAASPVADPTAQAERRIRWRAERHRMEMETAGAS